MKRIIYFIALSLAAFPLAAGAAFNDVTLTTSAIISVGGYSLNVTGSSALLQSITVNASSFDVTVAAGSLLTVQSNDKVNFSLSNALVSSSFACNSSNSTLNLSAASGATVTITPSGTCASSVGGSGSSYPSSDSSSSGGGGVVSVATVSATTTTSTTTTTTTLPVTQTTNTTTSSTGNTTSAPVVTITITGPVLTQVLRMGSAGEEVSTLQKFLVAKGYLVIPDNIPPGYFGKATQNALMKYQSSVGLPPVGFTGPATRAALSKEGTSTAAPQTTQGGVTFTRTLKMGATGDDVIKLQKILIAKGLLSDKSPLGYFGGMTQKALVEFQKQNGIDPVGFAGPSTRNALNAVGSTGY